ncbi:MAG: AraC family transcriptional regulator [Phreatobacter sp.]|nr:AraC family transcriptional regulator [Phreatobacter sp.]
MSQILVRSLNQDTPGPLERTVSAAWSGLVVQSSRRASDYSISYKSRATQHYLALHYFERREGETRIEGIAPSTMTDLRGKLTQIPAGYSAEAWTVEPSNFGHVTMLFFEPEKLSEDLGKLYTATAPRPRLFFEDGDLADALVKLDRLLTSDGDLNDLYAESLGLFISARMLELSRADMACARPALSSRSRMAVLEDYLRSNIGKPVSIEELARLAGLSRFHLIRSFRDVFGQTPYQYFLRLRMDEARRLLQSTNLQVAEIGARVGFSSSTQFVKMFRAIEGVTPGSLRQR